VKALHELRALAASAPLGTLLPAAFLAEWLEHDEEAATTATEGPQSWRLLFRTCPSEVRVGKAELLKAVGKGEAWLYRHSGPASKDRIAHRQFALLGPWPTPVRI
jgi:hypothetical protein